MERKIFLNNQESKYSITDSGEITNTKTGRKISKSLNHDGYVVVQLSHEGKKYNRMLHRLLAEAFIPNPNSYDSVDHINKVRDDNRLCNLRWCTWSENCKWGHIGRENYSRGENHHSNVYSEELIIEICERLSKAQERTIISNELGVTSELISAIYNRKVWCHISNSYVFIEYNYTKPTVYSKELKNKIINLHKKCYKTKDIIQLLDLDYNQKTRNYIKTLIQRFKNHTKGSTTSP